MDTLTMPRYALQGILARLEAAESVVNASKNVLEDAVKNCDGSLVIEDLAYEYLQWRKAAGK